MLECLSPACREVREASEPLLFSFGQHSGELQMSCSALGVLACNSTTVFRFQKSSPFR